MATNTEEIITRLGYNADAVTRGTRAMLEQQKRAAVSYVDFWKSAIETRDRAETVAAEKRIAREKATAEIVARNTLESLAKGQAAVAAAQAGISAGSIPANMAKGAEQAAINKWKAAGYDIAGAAGGGLAGSYLFKGGKVAGKLNAAGELEKAAETAVKGIAEMGTAAHGNSTALRETAVMIREGIRGAYTKMLGSFSIWLGAMWRPIGKLASAIERIPVVGKLFGPASTIFDAITIGSTIHELIKYRRAVAGQKESEADLKSFSEDTAGILRARVASLKSVGILTGKQAAGYDLQLKHGGFDNVSAVLSATNKYMRGGTADEQVEAIKLREKLNRLDSEHAKNVDAMNRKELTGQDRVNQTMLERHILMEQMSYLDKNSVDYKEKQLEADRLSLEIITQVRDVAKDKLEAEVKAREKKAQLDEEATSLAQRINGNEARIDEQGAEYPTIGELVKSRGPFAYFAKQFEKAQKDQIKAREFAQDADYFDQHDLQWHHISRAATIEAARQRENLFRGKLEDAGTLKPELNLARLVVNTNLMIKKLEDIHRRGGKEDPMFLADDE